MVTHARAGWGHLLLVLGALLTGSPAQAIRLDVVPSFTQKFVGDVFGVDVVVSGLDAATEVVSTFDLDVSYDPAILQALGVNFGAALGGGLPNSVQFGPFIGAGVIDFAESSLLLDADLDLLQGDSVTLATLSFRAIGAGISSLEFIQDPFFILTGRFDAQGIPADLNPDVGGGRVQVDARQVPVPGVLSLLGLGLIALALRWRLASGTVS